MGTLADSESCFTDMSASEVPVQPLRMMKKKSNHARRSNAHDLFPKECPSSLHLRISEMTPPLTPATSNEDLHPSAIVQNVHFYDYLRATYPYHPPCDPDPSTVTLPLNRGDIVLVHSIHSNGWADGTLLDSGRRGWLPTNYCEPFEPEPLQSLMKGTTTLWDTTKDCCDGRPALLSCPDLMRGVIAGVRHLLVRPSHIPTKGENKDADADRP